MTKLVVRKIPWEFDATVPFMWQPANPNFGLFCNAFTFIAVPVRALHRQRGPKGRRIASTRTRTSPLKPRRSCGRKRSTPRRIASTCWPSWQRYPELEQCYDDACNAYDELIDEQPIEFHAAYIANLEATFTPLFKVILDNRDSLFGGGDQRVASLMMWHFVEEIEHRSSGLILYRHINPDPWYRVKHVRSHVRPRRRAVRSGSPRPSTRSFPSKIAAHRRKS